MSIACIFETDRLSIVQEIGPGGWSQDRPAAAMFYNSDSLSYRTLSVLIRFRNDFSYDRLDVAVETRTPDQTVWRDTISVSLRPEFGGIETSSLTYTDVKTPYRTRVVLERSGKYSFRFTPMMPQASLEGVTGVGIEISNE